MEQQTGPAWTSAADEHADSEHAADEHADSERAAGEHAGNERAADDRPALIGPVTGEPRVDAALKLLDRLPGLPVSDHPELFEQVHAQLSEVLGELDSGPGTAGG